MAHNTIHTIHSFIPATCPRGHEPNVLTSVQTNKEMPMYSYNPKWKHKIDRKVTDGQIQVRRKEVRILIRTNKKELSMTHFHS